MTQLLADANAADAMDLAVMARSLRLMGKETSLSHRALDRSEQAGKHPLAMLERAMAYIKDRKNPEAREYLERFVEAMNEPDDESVQWAESMIQRLN